LPPKSDHFVIARRFCGPSDSGNGGYVAGCLAAHIDGPAEIALKARPPLDVALEVVREPDGSVRLMHGAQLVATARPAPAPLPVPPPVPSRSDVEAAAPHFDGFKAHILPPCFVCGTARAAGDGMRLFAAPIENSVLVASLWTPGADLLGEGGRVAREFLWAALDCPGYFSLRKPGLFALLARFRAEIVRAPRVGEPCIVAAWAMGADGRKHFAGSVVYGDDGAPIAVASALWIEPAANILNAEKTQ